MFNENHLNIVNIIQIYHNSMEDTSKTALFASTPTVDSLPSAHLFHRQNLPPASIPSTATTFQNHYVNKADSSLSRANPPAPAPVRILSAIVGYTRQLERAILNRMVFVFSCHRRTCSVSYC